MSVNFDKPDQWDSDTIESVNFYNTWFIEHAPLAFKDARESARRDVKTALAATDSLRCITPKLLLEHPRVLQIFRMATAPPIARDRLHGLSGVGKTFIQGMEMRGEFPARMSNRKITDELAKLGNLILMLADRDLFSWLGSERTPTAEELNRAEIVLADRLTGAVADPVIRNSQEHRQLKVLSNWFDARGYKHITSLSGGGLESLEPGYYTYHVSVPANHENGDRINVSVDFVVRRSDAAPNELPLLIEAKAAGDFTNVNKRRKEEAVKIDQLRRTFGEDVPYILFLCGYFNRTYLAYEAAHRIDWVWEHRLSDLRKFGF